MRTSFLAILIALVTSQTSIAERLITFDDLYSYPQIDALALSPDGKLIATGITTYDLQNDTPYTNIWIFPVDGTAPWQLTSGNSDTNPIWSSDGEKIAFCSTRPSVNSNNKSQIWTISVKGGEAVQLTDIYTEVEKPVWSGNGEYLLAQSSVYPGCDNDDCNREKDEEINSTKVEAQLYSNLLFRHYKYWEDSKRNHILLVNAESGSYEDLTLFDKDAPPVALAGDPGYAFSNDADEIAFVMNTDTVIAVSTNNDIFTLNIKTNQLTRISTSSGNDDNPQYSPSGRFISYCSMARAGYESDQRDLILYNRTQKTYENLTETFDRSVDDYIWDPYSKYIYFTAIDAGINKIYKLSLQTKSKDTYGQITPLVEDGVCWNLQVSSNGLYLYYTKSTATIPYEIFEYNNKTNSQTRLTYLSDSLITELKLSPVEDFWFAGANGDSVHGLITLPPDFNKNRKYPLTLLIHGGPQWCWLKEFNNYGWNTQLMAAQGYIVVQIDPHGSCGYGQPFTDAVNNDWGGVPYQDLMLGLDYVIANHAYIDTTRMGALGRSYGGYMVNWICGQTDRFACLVSSDGSFENISDYYSTDELWFPNWEFGGAPWQVSENYLKQSPANYVQNFTTPTLIIHGQLDYRVDISQGLMMFTALQTRNVPSQLLYFPDEGHSARKLPNIRYSYQVQFEWLAKYLK